jgi:hypothetical protein
MDAGVLRHVTEINETVITVFYSCVCKNALFSECQHNREVGALRV